MISGWRIVIACCLAALVQTLPQASVAQRNAENHIDSVSVQTMLQRDRFAKPQAELKAWRDYKQLVFENPATPASTRAQIQLRIGISYFYAADYDEALAQLEMAETNAQTRDTMEPAFWAELYAYRALTLADLKRFAHARAAAGQAMKSAGLSVTAQKTLSPSWISALTLNAAGYQAYKAGDMASAQRLMCRAASDARAALPLSEPLVHLNANNCGVFLYFADDPRAVDTLEEAATLTLAHLEEGHPVVGQALNTSYAVLYRLGRYPEAARLARTHMELEIRLRGEHSSRVYDPASMLSKALAEQGQVEAAAQIQAQVIGLADRMHGVGDFRARGTARLFYAKLLNQLGRMAESGDSYTQALKQFKTDFSGTHPNYALALSEYALHLAASGALGEALAHAKTSREIMADTLGPDHADRLSVDVRYAVLLARAGEKPAALAIGRRAHRVFKRQLATLSQGRAGRISSSSLLVRGFSRVTEIALRTGDDALALEAAQLASASELTLASADISAQALTKEEGYGQLITQLRSSRLAQAQAQRDLDERLASQGTPETQGTLSQSARSLKDAKAETRRIEALLERKFPQFRQLSQPEPVPLDAVTRTLASDQAIVIPLASFDRLFTLTVTRRGLSWAMSDASAYTLALYRAALIDSISQARIASLQSLPDFNPEPSYAIFRAIFPGSLYSNLSQAKQLLFVGSGPLSNVAPALLITRNPSPFNDYAWLLRDKSIAILSNFENLDHLDDRSGNASFIGFGDPELNGTGQQSVDVAQLFRGGVVDLQSLRRLPRLPGAKRELKKMSKAFGRKKSQLYLGGAFTQSTVEQTDFSRASVVAFATHGLTSEDIVGLTEPALVLTPPLNTEGGSSADGLLTASEIAALSMPVDWVILSACNSGAGRSASAPMYSGLAKAFRMAGAKTLLLSHWPVRDDAAAYLSTRTIGNAKKGMGKSEALRQAQLDMMDSDAIPGGGHPALWAPFVMIAN